LHLTAPNWDQASGLRTKVNRKLKINLKVGHCHYFVIYTSRYMKSTEVGVNKMYVHRNRYRLQFNQQICVCKGLGNIHYPKIFVGGLEKWGGGGGRAFRA
jgi:hypothetical protein